MKNKTPLLSIKEYETTKNNINVYYKGKKEPHTFKLVYESNEAGTNPKKQEINIPPQYREKENIKKTLISHEIIHNFKLKHFRRLLSQFYYPGDIYKSIEENKKIIRLTNFVEDIAVNSYLDKQNNLYFNYEDYLEYLKDGEIAINRDMDLKPYEELFRYCNILYIKAIEEYLADIVRKRYLDKRIERFIEEEIKDKDKKELIYRSLFDEILSNVYSTSFIKPKEDGSFLQVKVIPEKIGSGTHIREKTREWKIFPCIHFEELYNLFDEFLANEKNTNLIELRKKYFSELRDWLIQNNDLFERAFNYFHSIKQEVREELKNNECKKQEKSKFNETDTYKKPFMDGFFGEITPNDVRKGRVEEKRKSIREKRKLFNGLYYLDEIEKPISDLSIINDLNFYQALIQNTLALGSYDYPIKKNKNDVFRLDGLKIKLNSRSKIKPLENNRPKALKNRAEGKIKELGESIRSNLIDIGLNHKKTSYLLLFLLSKGNEPIFN